jgi:hypothetical protein
MLCVNLATSRHPDGARVLAQLDSGVEIAGIGDRDRKKKNSERKM